MEKWFIKYFHEFDFILTYHLFHLEKGIKLGEFILNECITDFFRTYKNLFKFVFHKLGIRFLKEECMKEKEENIAKHEHEMFYDSLDWKNYIPEPDFYDSHILSEEDRAKVEELNKNITKITDYINHVHVNSLNHEQLQQHEELLTYYKTLLMERNQIYRKAQEKSIISPTALWKEMLHDTTDPWEPHE